VDPDYIICWGSVAAQNLLGVSDSIGRLRRRFFQYGRARVLCTYHPSYLLRNPAAKRDVWEDMKFFFAELGIDLTTPAKPGERGASAYPFQGGLGGSVRP
jgi:uracil-DNA glycosylase family 4